MAVRGPLTCAILSIHKYNNLKFLDRSIAKNKFLFIKRDKNSDNRVGGSDIRLRWGEMKTLWQRKEERNLRQRVKEESDERPLSNLVCWLRGRIYLSDSYADSLSFKTHN
jgi:hypothetical protein